MDILAHLAAPVQVTWIGYPNTTGLECMHYRLTDAVADPPNSTQKFSEELVRLPDCFLCIAPPDDLLSTEVAEAPFEANGYVTFGTFNDVSKNSPSAMRLWGKILARLPNAMLKIKAKDAGKYSLNQSNFAQYADGFVATALDPNMPGFNFKSKAQLRKRVEMLPSQLELKDHFKCYNQVDIALDPFPYAGTTTSVDSLMMGVPVVTLRKNGAGACHAQNVTASLLAQAGLEDLIADCEEDYIRIAVELAQDTDRLRNLRSGLRQRCAL